MKYTPEEIAELLKERRNQPHYIAAMVRKAVEVERNACAIICEAHAASVMEPNSGTPWSACRDCADAIRARTTKDEMLCRAVDRHPDNL